MPATPVSAAKRILVAEDDPDIRDLILAQLAREPYALDSASSIAEARKLLASTEFDVLVLDLTLPDGDGLDLWREIRGAGFTGAIIMVTARCAPMDRLLGLELGADDYLPKPFEPRELLIRIRNLLRRLQVPATGRSANAHIARIGPWRLDMHQRRLVASSGRLVMLSGAEYRLLIRFLDNPNKVLSREQLLPERGATVAFDRSIDLQISRLRQKLSSEPDGAGLVLTVRGEGYVFTADVAFE